MTLDATARSVADRLVTQFGKTVTITRTTKTVYDPISGTGGVDDVITNYPNLKVTPPKDYLLDNLDKTLIEDGDQFISLPALNAPIIPEPDTDVVTYDGFTWKIKQLGYLYSGELVAMYTLHLGK